MNKLKLRNLIILMVAVIGFSVVSVVSIFNQGSSSVVSSAVRSFPAFSAKNLMVVEKTNSDSVHSANQMTAAFVTEKVMKGRGYQVVNVWATWCGVCRSEHDYLVALSERGIPLIGLNYRDDQSAALRYLNTKGNPFREVIFDPNGRLAIDLGVIGTPETYLIDNDGMILKKYIGRLTEQVWNDHFSDSFHQTRVEL